MNGTWVAFLPSVTLWECQSLSLTLCPGHKILFARSKFAPLRFRKHVGVRFLNSIGGQQLWNWNWLTYVQSRPRHDSCAIQDYATFWRLVMCRNLTWRLRNAVAHEKQFMMESHVSYGTVNGCWVSVVKNLHCRTSTNFTDISTQLLESWTPPHCILWVDGLVNNAHDNV